VEARTGSVLRSKGREFRREEAMLTRENLGSPTRRELDR